VSELPARADVVVVGAGIAGAAAAYFLARSGTQVVLIDRSGTAAEASGGNAGMIGESGGDPATTMHLQQLSIMLYADLARETGDGFELTMAGRLLIALTPDEVRKFEALAQRSIGAGIEGQMLYGAEVQQLEPALSSRVLAAAWFPGDGKLHPVKATTAFYDAAVASGAVAINDLPVRRLALTDGRVTGVVTDRGEIAAGEVILAAGAWTPQLATTVGVHVPVFPGKGHMLATEPLPPLTDRVLRAVRLGARQMANGEILIGSEVEFAGYSKAVIEETIVEYLEFMRDLVPALNGVRVARSWGCLRPMSIDQLPIVGPAPGVRGLHLVTGHGRSGMGLGPASAKALVDTLLTGSAEIDLAPYDPGRFTDA
jgi:glycine/D-amino acid oxidase-like deaminating enzyme